MSLGEFFFVCGCIIQERFCVFLEALVILLDALTNEAIAESIAQASEARPSFVSLLPWLNIATASATALVKLRSDA